MPRIRPYKSVSRIAPDYAISTINPEEPAGIPLGAHLLESNEDAVVTREQLSEELQELARQAGSSFTAEDVWRALVEWMTHFFPDRLMKQEVADVGLRRAQVLDQ